MNTPPSRPKNVQADPDYEEYLNQWASLYEGKNYDEGLIGYFLKKSHEWAESRWLPSDHFDQVLEVGAGTGIHINFVRHSFTRYLMTDLNPPLLDQATQNLATPSVNGEGQLETAQEDATRLSFEDDSFDRVIAAHVLEHLPEPHKVVQEWARVLKPGGILTIVLPCDPGLAWRLGRYAVARRKFIAAGLKYDYWMAREHINPINNLVSLLRHYFPTIRENWLPCRIPSIDINLFHISHIKV